MRRWILSLFLMALTISAFSPAELRAEKRRKIRIHFYGVSYWAGNDSNSNHKFFSGASKAYYSAVWEATAPEGQFPTAFPKVVVQKAAGKVQQRSRGGTDDCDGDLTYSSEPGLQPGASIYFRDNKTVAIRIPAPHAAKMIRNSSSAVLCSAPTFPTYADGGGVQTIPGASYENLPPEPGSSTRVNRSNTAAFEVDIKRPDTSVFFSYSQTAEFSGESYKGVWFGVVTVDENPIGQAPGAPDLDKMTSYTPPPEYEEPTDPPPQPPVVLPGGFNRWLRDPFFSELNGALNALQTIWNSVTGPRKYVVRASQLGSDFTYDPATRTLTITSIASAPGAGTVTLSMGVGKGKLSNAGTQSFSAGGAHSYSFILPKSVEKAFTKGKAFDLKLSATISPILNRPGKAVVKKIGIKARK